MVNYITQQVRKAICQEFQPQVKKMRSLHKICCHLEEAYILWKGKNRCGFRDELQALRHLGSRNITKWWYDKE